MENIIFITLAAVISGAETWNEIQEFGQERYEWLSKYLNLENGIPSHDTFNRFFSTMDPDKFENSFRKWVLSLGIGSADDIVSIDGKTIKGSRGHSQSAIHMVSAWSKKSGLTLGQVRTAEKSNEIIAIPELLDALFLEGSIVTIDAMGTQTDIADKIIEKKADYILQLKKNHKILYQDVEKLFNGPSGSEFIMTDNKHGRIEKRKYFVITDLEGVFGIEKWTSLKAVVKLFSESTDKITGEVSESTAYYITSLDTNAERIGKAIRSHWGIENNLHWMLDVAFSEDKSQKRNKNAVVNFSLINKIALSMLNQDKSTKVGVKSKRMKAAWSTRYLEKVMGL